MCAHVTDGWCMQYEEDMIDIRNLDEKDNSQLTRMSRKWVLGMVLSIGNLLASLATVSFSFPLLVARDGHNNKDHVPCAWHSGLKVCCHRPRLSPFPIGSFKRRPCTIMQCKVTFQVANLLFWTVNSFAPFHMQYSKQ